MTSDAVFFIFAIFLLLCAVYFIFLRLRIKSYIQENRLNLDVNELLFAIYTKKKFSLSKESQELALAYEKFYLANNKLLSIEYKLRTVGIYILIIIFFLDFFRVL